MKLDIIALLELLRSDIFKTGMLIKHRHYKLNCID